MELDFDGINESLRNASAPEIVKWALGLGRRTIATTSMGRNAAVLLHMNGFSEESLRAGAVSGVFLLWLALLLRRT